MELRLEMSAEKWTHSNKYNAAAACETCAGIIRHEPWCPVVNASVLYLFECIIHPALLRESDQIALHALGVMWGCPGKCA